jgi:hypothetical protein
MVGKKRGGKAGSTMADGGVVVLLVGPLATMNDHE